MMSGIFKAYDIRGIYPEQLNEEMAEKIGRAFVTFLGAKKVVIGRDMRPHSVPLFNALAKGITEQGCDVVDLGLCSTPQTYHANGILKADGSIMITASHNTREWNGFKLCRKDDVPISGATGIADIQKLVEDNKFPVSDVKGTVTTYDISADYKKFLRGFAKMDRKLKVVADFANAMGSYEIAGIEDLFEIVPMYRELDGTFPNHEANPLHTENIPGYLSKQTPTQTSPPKTILYKAWSSLSVSVAFAAWTRAGPPRHRPLRFPCCSQIPCRSLLFHPFPAPGPFSFLPTLPGTLHTLPDAPSQTPRFPRLPSVPHKGATNPVQCYIPFSCSFSSNPFLNMVPAR